MSTEPNTSGESFQSGSGAAGSETSPPTGQRMTRDKLAEEFSKHRERLWRAVQVRMDPRLYGRVDPDDVLQEAYLDAEKRLNHFAEKLDCSAFIWLRLVVGQTLINIHRRHIGAKMRDASRDRSASQKLRHEFSASSQAIAYQISAQQTSPSGAALRTERVHELTEALDELKPIDREILTLRHFEDLSNKEVAELLEITEKNASIRYVRAIQRLKGFLQSNDEQRK